MTKKILTISAAAILSATGLAFTASAHEEDGNVQQQQPVYEQRGDRNRDDDRRGYENRDGGSRLEGEVNHLNRMVEHVRAELRQYGADRHVRGEFEHLRAESYQLDNQFRRGAQFYDRRRLRAQIEHMHGELHHIEQELHVPTQGYYQWR